MDIKRNPGQLGGTAFSLPAFRMQKAEQPVPYTPTRKRRYSISRLLRGYANAQSPLAGTQARALRRRRHMMTGKPSATKKTTEGSGTTFIMPFNSLNL